MAKPILVINYCIEGMSMSMAVRNLNELQKVVSESNANDEYYTFLLPVRTDSNIQVFYDKDLKETDYLQLKKIIEDKMEFFKVDKGFQEVDFDERFEEYKMGPREKIKDFFRNIFKR